LRRKKGKINFILIRTKDDNSEENIDVISNVVRTVQENNGVIVSITSCILAVMFGYPISQLGLESEKRIETIKQLIHNIGKRISIIHGQKGGEVGLLGTNEYTYYGFCISNFSEILMSLMKLNMGDVVEVSE
jgi:hypothetical protein